MKTLKRVKRLQKGDFIALERKEENKAEIVAIENSDERSHLKHDAESL